MLCAEEIVSQGYKKAILPDSGGQKEFSVNNSPRQQNSIDHTLYEHEVLIQEERVVRKLNLSIAHWNSDLNKAVVDIRRRNHFQKFGHETAKCLYLLPEETLFLVDQGCLELYHNDLPLSVEDCYVLLLPLLNSLEYYQVYSYLCRLGYIVVRYTHTEPQDTDPVSISEREDDTTEIQVSTDEEYGDEFALEPMISGFASHLWKGEEGERPLVKPSEATSTFSILSNLDIVKPMDFVSTSTSAVDNTNVEFSIHFDVYALSSIKKKDRGRPQFRLVVCKYTEPPPSLLQLAKLAKESGSASLKLAVVDHGTISFYSMFGTSIPTLVSLG